MPDGLHSTGCTGQPLKRREDIRLSSAQLEPTPPPRARRKRDIDWDFLVLRIETRPLNPALLGTGLERRWHHAVHSL
jgi:hypothetical protein